MRPAAPELRDKSRTPISRNLASAPPMVQNQPPMGQRLPQELLQELRTSLQHFDQTGHMGESETVAEIKRRLRQRIGEVEAQLRMPQPGNGPKRKKGSPN